MADEIARAGLGLELEGGSAVIQDLRTIHALMSGIVSLAGAIPKGVGGAFEAPDPSKQRQTKQGYDSHVQQFTAAEKAKTRVAEEESRKRRKLEEEEARSAREAERQRKRTGPISTEDVNREVAAINRKAELKRQAEEAVARSERARANAQTRKANEERARAEAEAMSFENQLRIRRARLAAGQNPNNPQAGIGRADVNQRIADREGLSPYNRAQSSAFRRARFDPAQLNDPATSAMRSDYARGVTAWKEIARRDRQAAQAETEAHYNRQLADLKTYRTNLAKQLAEGPPIDVDAQRRGLRRARFDPAAQNDPITQQYRDETAVQTRASKIQQREARARQQAVVDAENARRAEEQAAQARAFQYRQRRSKVRTQRELRTYAEDNFDEFSDPSGLRSYFSIDRKLQPRAAAENDQQYRDQYAMRNIAVGRNVPPRPPTPPRSSGGGRGGRGDSFNRQAQLRDPQGLFNEKGFFTSGEVLGRITRNILLYEVVSRATYGLSDYIGKAIQAAKTTVEFSNALRFATEQAGGNIGTNERLADSLAAIGLSRQQGRAAVTEAARFAENRPQDTEALTRTVANIAAARGGGVDKTDELIEQLRRRESKFYKRIFGTTVENIYQDYAAQQVDAQTTSRVKTPGLYIDEKGTLDYGKKIESRTTAIKKFVEGMDDAAKETAVFNFVLSQSTRFQGEADERANTLAGRLDKMAAAWLNAQEGVGLFITELQPLNDIVDALSKKAGFLDGLRPPSIGRSGQGGTIGTADIERYAQQKTTGFRYNALTTINESGLGIAGGILGLGASALLGRGGAKEEVRLQAYNKAFDEYVTKFNGNIVAAQNEAVKAAKDLKPGFARSVGAGLNRVTVGMTDAITGITGGTTSSRFGANLISPVAQQAIRGPSSTAAYDLGPYSRPIALGKFGLLTDRSGREYDPTGAEGRSFGRYFDGSNAVKGSFSSLSSRGKTVTQGQYDRLLALQGATSVAGGLAGAAVGAEIGNLIATKLDVGPITATTMTIAGGVIGNAVGTTVGTAIGSSLVSYIAAQGGLLALGEAGLSTLFTGGASAATVAATAVTGAVGVGGLLLGGAVGTAVNYLNPYDSLSEEQRGLDRDTARNEAYQKREKEYRDAAKERRVLYRDNRSGPSFNQLYTEAQARQIDPTGFAKGFDVLGRSFKREVYGRNDPVLEAFKLRTTRRDTSDGTTDVFGNANQETVLNERVELEQKLTGEFSSQQQIQEEIASIRAKDADASDDVKKADDVRIKQLEEQAGIMSQIAVLKTKEAQLSEFGTTDEKQIAFLSDYRARQAQSTADRKAKDQKDLQEQVNQQANALSKLRDTAEGAFKSVYDVANIKAGGDNPFVKVLADSATLSERMDKTWGHLGSEIVASQKHLEQIAIDQQRNHLQFESYLGASNIRGQARREDRDRNLAPGLSRSESDFLDIQSAIVNKALELPKLWQQVAEVMGRPVNQLDQLRGRVKELQVGLGLGAREESPSLAGVPFGIAQRDANGNLTAGPTLFNQGGGGRIAGFSAGPQVSTFYGPNGEVIPGMSLDAGSTNDYAAYAASQAQFNSLSPEVQKRTRELYASSALDVFSQYSPQQIRQAGLAGTYAQAAAIKAGGLDDQIGDARKKAEYGAAIDADLAQQLREDEQFRNSQRAKALVHRDGDTSADIEKRLRDVGVESDRAFLARTDQIAPKDLTFDQFKERQDALGREADRKLAQEAEAQKAIQDGLDMQGMILDAVGEIRDAVVAGNLSMLVQVQNDTQARVDRDNLEEAYNGRYNVNLDQQGPSTNPNGKPLQQKYNRKGYTGKGYH